MFPLENLPVDVQIMVLSMLDSRDSTRCEQLNSHFAHISKFITKPFTPELIVNIVMKIYDQNTPAGYSITFNEGKNINF